MKDKDEAILVSVPPPIKGWFTSEALGQLRPEFAAVLDNFICYPDAPTTRKGSANHVTGFSAEVQSLMAYYANAAPELYAATNAGIFNATTAGAVGASVTTLTNGYGRSILFSTTGGKYLLFLNGVDNVKRYDGTTWVTITAVSPGAITGPVTTSLFNAVVYRRRAFFLQNNHLGFWYLPVDSISGALTEFNLGSIFQKGGRSIAVATWSIDGGAGQDDYLAIATTNGEVAVYSGGDPSSLTDWNLVGVFDLGKPVGQNCFAKLGGDLLYLCDSGLYPLSQALASVAIDREKAISRNIEPTLAKNVQLYKANQGWGVHVLQSKSVILINAALADPEQYVMHLQTKGWSRFTGLDCLCWIEFDKEVYAGQGTTVRKMFTGDTDQGVAIAALLRTSYSRYGSLYPLYPVQILPVLLTPTPLEYDIGIANDYTDNYIRQTVDSGTSSWAIADVSLWDVGLWSSPNRLQNRWQTVAARAGFAGSIEWSAAMSTTPAQLIGFTLRMSVQGPVM